MQTGKYIEKITILIFTHYRQAYLRRVLDYYQDFNLNIAIADSTNNPFFYDKQSKNIKYFHYPNYPFNTKMAEIFCHVTTPYVLLCADDDFYVPSAIQSCINFLEANQDFSSVQGQSIYFTGTNSKGFDVTLFYVSDKSHEANALTAEERLMQTMKNYVHQYHSVHRTEIAKCCFQKLHSLYSNRNLGEIGITLVPAINGKHRILPIFYQARERLETAGSLQVPGILEIIANSEMRKEYEIFLEAVTNYFCQQTGYKQSDGRICIEQAMELYLKKVRKYELDDQKFKKPTTYRRFKSLTKACVPIVFLQYLQNLQLKRETKKLPGFPFNDADAKKEWEIIKSFVLKHNAQV